MFIKLYTENWFWFLISSKLYIYIYIKERLDDIVEKKKKGKKTCLSSAWSFVLRAVCSSWSVAKDAFF